MKRSVCILGSGKMARNIGIFFVKNRYAVSWISANKTWLAECEKQVVKESRRLQRYFDVVDPDSTFYTYESVARKPADIIIEAAAESLDHKKRAIGKVDHGISGGEAILASTSSSILPSVIHPRCIGCHFFYPVELTGTVELITHPAVPETTFELLSQELNLAGITVLRQDETTAFAVNRLLLPLQNEVIRLLGEGYDPRAINSASASAFIPAGQLAFMDNVGLDTMHAGVVNYTGRMPDGERRSFQPLIQGLSTMIAAGKLGRKNNNGFLMGAPLPWQAGRHTIHGSLQESLCDLFLSTCRSFIHAGQITVTSLNRALGSVFQAETLFPG